MSDPTQLRKFLRFQLDELSTENGHHTFELICREVARARIASNLLTATGPVSAGGDAGRDFETFTSYLPAQLGEHNAFVAKLTDKSLAFACTLQKKNADRKFAKDIDTIVTSGDKFDKVYAMCAVPIETGRRNRLRNKVRERHGIEVEVLDGLWLSEQLADNDLFWVAERWLSIPAHMSPPPPSGGATSGRLAWYDEDLAEWRSRGEMHPTVRDVLDAKDGLRYATFHAPGRDDLVFWLELFKPLTNAENPRDVRQRARYEYAVATLRGVGEMRPADDITRAFFEDVLPEDDPARLKDASVLLTYAVGAYSRNVTDLEASYIRGVNDRLRSHIEALLAAAPLPTRRAQLLDVLANLALQPDALQVQPSPEPVRVDGADYVDDQGNFKAPAQPLAPQPDFPFIDFDAGMNAWVELAEGLQDTRLFPVDDLAAIVNLSAPLLIHDSRWRRLVDAVDAAVRRTAGDGAAGDSARERAVRLLDADQLREALGEMHAAKVNWWSGDHLYGSLLAMLLISDIYLRLGMAQAAKQYALAASGAAMASGDDQLRSFVPRGLLAAANADYNGGAWCNAVDLYELAFTAVQALVDFDLADDNLMPAMANFAVLLRSTRVVLPELQGEVEKAMRRCDMADLIGASEEAPLLSAQEVVAAADSDMGGRPFADVGEERVFRFAALGLNWTVRCKNAYEHVLVAERFVAAAQVLLVELAGKDLCFLQTTVDVRVAPCANGEAAATQSEASNDGRKWTVTLMPGPAEVTTATRTMPAHDAELLAALAEILLDASLLPQDRYFAEFDDAFRRGLVHKLGTARPYDELAQQAIPRETFDAFGRKQASAPTDPSAHPAREHEQLAWQSGPGPGYSRVTAEEMLVNRYELFAETMRYTLPRLLVDPGFRALIARLREERWLDWQIATALFARTQNMRMERAGIGRSDFNNPAVRKRLNDLVYEPEKQSWGTPPANWYTYEDMVFQRRVNMLKLVEYWGLELRQNAPDLPAIEKFLVQRYEYSTDDIDHVDPFLWGADASAAREPAKKKTRARRN